MPAGEMHTLPLPFAATTLWPTTNGLLLQNTEEENSASSSLGADADLRTPLQNLPGL